MEWLPEPPAKTRICLGFDGSDVGDWTALKAETFDGLLFTPRTPDGDPAIWNPLECKDQRVQRGDVLAAVARAFEVFEVERMYCDPFRWETDVQQWDLRFGPKRVMEWHTTRPKQMHAALQRFTDDLTAGRITHDGCPITAVHMENARKYRPSSVRDPEHYMIKKATEHQKIDAAMASVLAHEAAADARAAGWSSSRESKLIFFTR